ncbi:MAG: hypothetical protein KOO60_11440 [Gemmatimonadales bacterium]|nr:hypothetical protein [Gemmatimonadales bacterium]
MKGQGLKVANRGPRVSDGSMNSSSESSHEARGMVSNSVRRALPLWSSGHRVSALAAAMVLLLALGAVLWPGAPETHFHGVCLVFDPAGGKDREVALFHPLTDFLAKASGHSLNLVMTRDVAVFQAQLGFGADFVICPDGLGLTLDSERFIPLVAGRRTAPRNLRPRGVLVYKRSVGFQKAPWLTRTERIIFGDSLSLTATGPLRADSAGSAVKPTGFTFGPDPYDHSPVLHSLRLGCFDFALVRQWDAERFFAEGLLSEEEWGVEIVTGPVPDLVLFVSQDIPTGRLLGLSRELTRLGRPNDGDSPESGALMRGLSGVHLSGFNLLVGPDLDLVRGSFPGRWPLEGP